MSVPLHCRMYVVDAGVVVRHRVSFVSLDGADTNGDGYFDEQELEALFTKEVKSRCLKTLVFQRVVSVLTVGLCRF